MYEGYQIGSDPIHLVVVPIKGAINS